MFTIRNGLTDHSQYVLQKKNTKTKQTSLSSNSFIYSNEAHSQKMHNFNRGLLHQFVSFKGIQAMNSVSFGSSDITPLQKETIKAIVNIFETGKPLGDYSKVTLLKGDSGHLTYGRSQTTLASGNLYLLIKDYYEKEGAQYAGEFKPYLTRLANKDLKLDHDEPFKALLKKAGKDKVMQKTQDEFFDRAYYDKAHKKAKSLGITTPLGVAVVYDSYVHGSFNRIYDRTVNATGKPDNKNQKKWVREYVNQRYNWLANHKNKLLQKTVYRMNTFKALMDGNLPLIYLTDPPQKGKHIQELQKKLKEKGYNIEVSGTYDQKSKDAVIKFQADNNLTPDGWVGNKTYNALGYTQGNWDLELPVKAHGRLITADLFDVSSKPPVVIDDPVDPDDPVKPDDPIPDTPDASDKKTNRPILMLTKPWMKDKPGETPFIKTIQSVLQRRGYSIDTDGNFGPQTDSIVKQFQKHTGLKQDGIIGPQTYEALRINDENQYKPEYPDILPNVNKPYQQGDHISEVQNILLNKGYAISKNGGVDGIYDPDTYRQVKKYQADNKLTVDGWVGNKTYKSLGLIEV